MNRTKKSTASHLRPPSPETTLDAHLPSATTTGLCGHWLIMAQLGTLALVGLAVAALLPLLPAYMSYLATVCGHATCPVGQLTPPTVRALQAVGLSTSTFVTYTLTLTLLALLMCWSVAAVIFWRKSNDWMALVVAFMLVLMGTSYITHLVLQRPSPWQVPALILNILAFGALFLVFCLFPSGRFVPSWLHWLPVGWIAWGLVMICLHDVPGFYSLYLVGFLCGLIAIVSAQVYRYRRISTVVERQQTKWVVWGASVAMVGVVGVSLPEALLPSLVQQSWLYRLLDAPALTLALFLGSLSIGIAVLRHRLWDIDLIIKRTLVYAILTTALALIYAGLVFVLQSLVHGLISQTVNSDVAIFLSTLAIAALFQPLRRHIQSVIDRRFYRSRYDAAKTVEVFSATQRNEVDLGQLSEQLMAVVQETMQPTQVSLWLRQPERHEAAKTRTLPEISTG